ncbi:MAG: cytochrome d ubiquinol oxidase subunit II [Bacteroidales bacterium]|nr:cytochrome d ubiquinol oxidase subunit II [Bacteroidales bacterium]
MITYSILQQYWWFLVSLLGGLLVFLLFVQGANTLIFRLGKTEEERQLIVNSTGRKWEFTFTTLVTFGGAFFASFPLFYSTSFGGAYWVWMLILLSFVLQAVAYEFQSKPGNVLGRTTYRRFLVFNGVFGPFLLGCAVGTFFNGAAFTVSKEALGAMGMPGVISSWANAWHGLDALFNPWNVVLGIAVLFLSRILGSLYLANNLATGHPANTDSSAGISEMHSRLRHQVLVDTIPFLLCFLAFVGHLLTMQGYAVTEGGVIQLVPEKYLHNLLDMPIVAVIFLLGVVLVLCGIFRMLRRRDNRRCIWHAGFGTVFTVLALLLLAGFNDTPYYPSTVDAQSSLTLANSCSSEFTLTVMSWVSLFIPFVLAYIVYAWWSIDRKSLTSEELQSEEHKY